MKLNKMFIQPVAASRIALCCVAALLMMAITRPAWAQFTQSIAPPDGYRTGDSNVEQQPQAAQRSRMQMLGDAPQQKMLGRTPVPDEATKEKFDQYLGDFIDPQSTIELIVGQPRLLTLRRPPTRIQLPADSLVAYQLLTDRQLSLIGLKVGSTLMNLWFPSVEDPTKSEVLSFIVRVLPDPEAKVRMERAFEALEAEVNKAFPNSFVRLVLVGDAVLVKGQAVDVNESERIVEIIEANMPSQTALSLPVGNERQAPAAAPTGAVDTLAIPGLRDFGLNPKGAAGGNAQAQTNRRVINMLTVPGEQQIMLRVTIAEMNRSAARAIGLSWSIEGDDGDSLVSISHLVGGGNIPIILDEGQVELALNALRNLQLARTLAEPNLVTMNNVEASFSAGGAFPVPVVTGSTSAGLQGVSFADFGIDVSFTPTIIQRNIIRLKISATSSERDESIGASIGGSEVSGLRDRTVQTTVEMKAGQTLAIAGLIQQNFGSGTNHIPGAGDLPFVGWMFGNRQTSTDEQELIMLVNVELVQPLDAKEVPDLPGSAVYEPDDLEFYLGGRLESVNDYDNRSPARTDWDRWLAEPQNEYDDRPVSDIDGRPSRSIAPMDPDARRRMQKLEADYIVGPTGRSSDSDQ